MKKTARILFLIVGSVMPILVGLLHTQAHFADLLTPEVQNILNREIQVQGEQTNMFAAWGVISLMMGASFLIIGLLNISTWLKLDKEDAPPIFPILIMFGYLKAVIYVGITFDATKQLYGGIVGIILLTICLALTLISRKKA